MRASADVSIGDCVSDVFTDLMPGGVLMHFPSKPIDGQVCCVSNDTARLIFPDSVHLSQVGDPTSSDDPEDHLRDYVKHPFQFPQPKRRSRESLPKFIAKAHKYLYVPHNLKRWVSSLPSSDHYMANIILRCVRFSRWWSSSNQPFPNARLYTKPACGPDVENFLNQYVGVHPNVHHLSWESHVLAIYSEIVRAYLAKTSGIEYVSWDPLPPKLK